MVKTRFQIFGNQQLGQKEYRHYSEVIQAIWKEEGIRGFFKGLTSSYIGCFEGAIQWILYERLKKMPFHLRPSQSFSSFLPYKSTFSSNSSALSPHSSHKPNVVDLFCMAAASKFVAICMTYPHEVIRTRIREQAINGVFKYQGFLSTFQTIAREEGIK